MYDNRYRPPIKGGHMSLLEAELRKKVTDPKQRQIIIIGSATPAPKTRNPFKK